MKKIVSLILVAAFIFGFVPLCQEVDALSNATVWDGIIATSFDGGSGTETNPYRIATAGQLAFFAKIVNTGVTFDDQYFILDNDIYLNDVKDYYTWASSSPKNVWIPIGKSSATAFEGNFDGGGYTIYGMYVENENCAGFFGAVTSATIKNICLVNAKVVGTESVGGIIGKSNGSTVTNCTVDGSISGSTYVGGIIGNMTTSQVTCCANFAAIAGEKNVGGIVGKGWSYPTISECYNTGNISGTNHVGGIIGYLNVGGQAVNCYNTGSITSTGRYVGGIGGECFQNGASLNQCYNIGLVRDGKGPGVCGEAWLGAGVSYSYYIAESGTGGKGTALTSDQMANVASFTGFDFDSVWTMNESVGRPMLKNNLEGMPDTYDNVSSEYSSLMGDAWKNAGMENINEYLLTMPSIAKAIVDSYNADQSFMAQVATWKYIEYLFEPANMVDNALSLKDYYSSVLLSLVNSSIADQNYVKQITEAGKFEEIKLSSEITDLIKSCDEIDHEKLLSGGTCTIEEITKLNNKINSLDDYSGAVSKVGKFLKAGNTINESINLYINYSNVKNSSTYIINVLNKIKENSTDPLLAAAIDEIVYASETSFAAIETGLCEGVINAGKDYGLGAINKAWQAVMASTSLGKGLLIGYKIGKPLSNALFATDAIISNYFDFVALCEVERALKLSIKDFETDFYNNKDADASLNYINAVAICFKTYYLSLDYATNLSKHSNLCPFAYVFYNGKQKFEDAIAQYASTRSGLREYEDLLFRLWAYSLKEQYPNVYAEIVPSLGTLYPNDLSAALVRLEYLSHTYTGDELRPTVTVTMGSAVLMPSEYTVTYHNNVKPGVATVQIIAAEGSLYTGTKATSFTIKELPFERRLSIQGSLINHKTSKSHSKMNDIELPDIYFYDGEQLVAAVENGAITKDDLPIYITENGIDVLMHDKDYTVKIRGDSTLTYNAELQKLDENYSIIETSNYNNLLLIDDIRCNIYSDTADEVIVNGRVQTPDYTSVDTSNSEKFQISFDKCATDNYAYEGQRVYVGAIIPEGHVFTGWRVSPQLALSSNSAVSSFIMPGEHVSIAASFTENPSYYNLKNTILEATEIDLGIYTISSYSALQLAIENAMLVLTDDITDSLSKEKIDEIQAAINALEEIPTLEFKGTSLLLQDSLTINCKVDKTLFEEIGYTNPYVVFNFSGADIAVCEYSETDMLYSFALEDVAATQMNETVYGTLFATYNDAEYASTTISFTVRQYCDAILADDSHSQYHALVKEMLNYGAMAQVYFEYDAENLANDGITDVANAEVPEITEELAVNGKINGLKFYGASLVYRDRIAVRYYFTGDITGLTFTANGNTYAPVAKDGMYYVEIADILPQNLDQQITLTATDADGNTLSVTYGPMNYIVRMNEKGSADLQNLLKALYNYHLAAKNL